MVMLYQDPQGIKSGVFTSQTERKGTVLSSQVKENKSVDLEMKVKQLEKTLQERDKAIAELQSKIEIQDSVMYSEDQNACKGYTILIIISRVMYKR